MSTITFFTTDAHVPRGTESLDWLMSFSTAVGVVRMRWCDGAVHGIALGALTDMQQRTLSQPSLPSESMREPCVRVATRLQAHLDGKLDGLQDVPVSLASVSAFGVDVLAALREVGPGQSTTYGKLAAAVGRPGAARAVGRVMAANPVPLIVPCHRCLAANGGLTGFSAQGGLPLKEKLLTIEGATGFRPAA